MNGGSLPSKSREEKPQPDSPGQLSKGSISFLHKDEDDPKDELTQREDMHQKEEIAPKEEAISLPTKKKKKALLQRLGTYLEKKKSQQTPLSSTK